MSHRCDETIERLGAYIDGELDEIERREVESHLAACPSCRAMLDDLSALDRFVRHETHAEPVDTEREEASLARTLERLRQEPEPEWTGARKAAEPERTGARQAAGPRTRDAGRRWGLTWRWAVGMAAATAAVLLALRIGPSPTAPDRRIAMKPQAETAQATREEGAATQNPPSARPQATAPPTPAAAPVPEPILAKRVQEAGDETVSPADKTAQNGEIMADLTAEIGGADGIAPGQEMKVRAAPGDAAARTDAPHEAPEELTVTLQEMEARSPAVRESGHPFPSIAPKDETAGRQVETITNLYTDEPDLHLRGGGKAKGGSLSLSAPDSDWYLGVGAAETTAVMAARRGEMEGISARVLREAERVAGSTPQERADLARRARALGNLWEWISRRESSAAACRRAVDSYEVAIGLDSEAAEVDSLRMRRARSGAR